MKKINLLFVVFIAVFGLFTACEPTENGSAPNITFDDGGEITLAEGVTTKALTGTIAATEKLDEVVVFRVVGSDETQIATYTSFTSGDITTTDDENYNFRITVSSITEETTIRIEATDKEDQVAKKNIVIKVTGTPAAPNLKAEFTAILLGAQQNAEPSCLDVNTGVRYSISDNNTANNSAVIDILYYYGTQNNATLAAPNDPSVNGTGTNSFNWTGEGTGWNVQNATKFAISSLDYSTVTKEQINDITGLSASLAKTLALGNVVAFQTSEGKKGLLKVTALVTGATGTITIAVKIQE